MVLTLTSGNFREEVLQSGQPVLVDFWASWCGPCQKLGPIVDEVAAEDPGAKTGKVNVDEQNQLAAEYGVMSIPTLILFQNGKAVKRSVGVISKQELLSMLQS